MFYILVFTLIHSILLYFCRCMSVVWTLNLTYLLCPVLSTKHAVCLCVCQSVYMYVCMYVCVSVSLCLSVCLYVCMYVCVSVSLSTIVKVSKSAGVLLKPHVSLLVISLLESVTTLEPQMMNYLSLHAAANQAAADKVSSYPVF